MAEDSLIHPIWCHHNQVGVVLVAFLCEYDTRGTEVSYCPKHLHVVRLVEGITQINEKKISLLLRIVMYPLGTWHISHPIFWNMITH